MLMERTKLNRLPQADALGTAGRWHDAIREQAREIEPGRSLSDLWFPEVGMWSRRLVHARVRAAARDWPAGHKPQAFLVCPAHQASPDERRCDFELAGFVLHGLGIQLSRVLLRLTWFRSSSRR